VHCARTKLVSVCQYSYYYMRLTKKSVKNYFIKLPNSPHFFKDFNWYSNAANYLNSLLSCCI